MRFSELVALYAQIHQADQTCRREYKLSDCVAVSVYFIAVDERPPKVHMVVCRTDRPILGDDEPYMMAHMDGLTPTELVKFAEIKSMVDAWVDGRTDTLPVSTSTVLEEAWVRSQAKQDKLFPR